MDSHDDSQYADLMIRCADCQEAFPFTAKEQAFYASRAFTAPRRCKPCRAFRKAEREASQVAS